MRAPLRLIAVGIALAAVFPHRSWANTGPCGGINGAGVQIIQQSQQAEAEKVISYGDSQFEIYAQIAQLNNMCMSAIQVINPALLSNLASLNFAPSLPAPIVDFLLGVIRDQVTKQCSRATNALLTPIIKAQGSVQGQVGSTHPVIQQILTDVAVNPQTGEITYEGKTLGDLAKEQAAIDAQQAQSSLQGQIVNQSQQGNQGPAITPQSSRQQRPTPQNGPISAQPNSAPQKPQNQNSPAPAKEESWFQKIF